MTVSGISIVNAMYVVDTGHQFDLPVAQEQLGPDRCKLYRGRPQMLVIQVKRKGKVQLFSCGKMEIMGKLPPSIALSMACKS